MLSMDMTANLARNLSDYVGELSVRPVSYLEVGTFEGGSAMWVLDHVLLHPDSRCYCVDSWLDSGSRKRLSGGRRRHKIWNGFDVERTARANLEPYGDKVVIVKGDSAAVLAEWQCGKHQLVYVDADHTYEGCLRDSLAIWPLVDVGGLVVWDDYSPLARRSRIQVGKAVRDFLRTVDGQYEVEFSNNQCGVIKRA